MANNEKKENQEKKEENQELTEDEKKALKKLEEELLSFYEQEKKKKENPLVFYFNIGLHKNFFIHILLMYFSNLLALSTVIGLIGFGTINNPALYLLGILLFTLLETGFKVFFFKYMSKHVIKSFGAMNLLYLIPLYYISIVWIGNVSFSNLAEHITIFSTFFVLRLFIRHYIKKISFRR